jgi:hypothetical protein
VALKAVERPDLRVANLQNQVAYLVCAVTQVVPQHLYPLEHRLGRPEQRSRPCLSPTAPYGLVVGPGGGPGRGTSFLTAPTANPGDRLLCGDHAHRDALIAAPSNAG